MSPRDLANGITMSRVFPAHYMITGRFADHTDFQVKLKRSLEVGPKVVQLRCKGVGDAEYLELAHLAEEICHQLEAILFLATTVELYTQTDADGLHLSSDILGGFSERPIVAGKLLSVSCHTAADIKLADSLGADVFLLSPVKPTVSHPDLPGLGWDRFHDMTEGLQQPVYGLGGMQIKDTDEAQAAGAQGIATTAGFWI